MVGVSAVANLIGHCSECGQRPGTRPGSVPEGFAGPRQPESVPGVQVKRLGLIQQSQRRVLASHVVERPRSADQPLPAPGRTGAEPGRLDQRRCLSGNRPAAQGPVRGGVKAGGHLLVRRQAGLRPVPDLTIGHACQHLRQGLVHDLPPRQAGRLAYRGPHQRMPEPHARPVHLGQPCCYRVRQICRRHRRARHQARGGQRLRQRIPVIQSCRQQRGEGRRRQTRQAGRERLLQALCQRNPSVQDPTPAWLANRRRQLHEGERITGRRRQDPLAYHRIQHRMRVKQRGRCLRV